MANTFQQDMVKSLLMDVPLLAGRDAMSLPEPLAGRGDLDVPLWWHQAAGMPQTLTREAGKSPGSNAVPSSSSLARCWAPQTSEEDISFVCFAPQAGRVH